MINLAEGIEERAIERTTKVVTEKVTKEVTREVTKEMNENFVMSMYELGYTYVQISDVTKLDVNDIKTIIDAKAHKD